MRPSFPVAAAAAGSDRTGDAAGSASSPRARSWTRTWAYRFKVNWGVLCLASSYATLAGTPEKTNCMQMKCLSPWKSIRSPEASTVAIPAASMSLPFMRDTFRECGGGKTDCPLALHANQGRRGTARSTRIG